MLMVSCAKASAWLLTPPEIFLGAVFSNKASSGISRPTVAGSILETPGDQFLSARHLPVPFGPIDLRADMPRSVAAPLNSIRIYLIPELQLLGFVMRTNK